MMSSKPLAAAIIVARGGGSTLYRKNAYDINGRPVLGWAVDILRRAGFVSQIFVWTEDRELAAIAAAAGAVPLERPRDMVHYFSGYYTLAEWNRNQREQMRDRLGRDPDVLVSFNCNCICFSPRSLRAMYERLLGAEASVLRVQAVCRVEGGLCLENPGTGRLFPVWNDTEEPQNAAPPLYRMAGVGLVRICGCGRGDCRDTLYYEVPPEEGFDFQHADDVPFAGFYLDRVAAREGEEAVR